MTLDFDDIAYRIGLKCFTYDRVAVEDQGAFVIEGEELQEEIITAAKGVIRKMPQVASWMDKTGELYYVAIGRRLK